MGGGAWYRLDGEGAAGPDIRGKLDLRDNGSIELLPDAAHLPPGSACRSFTWASAVSDFATLTVTDGTGPCAGAGGALTTWQRLTG